MRTLRTLVAATSAAALLGLLAGTALLQGAAVSDTAKQMRVQGAQDLLSSAAASVDSQLSTGGDNLKQLEAGVPAWTCRAGDARDTAALRSMLISKTEYYAVAVFSPGGRRLSVAGSPSLIPDASDAGHTSMFRSLARAGFGVSDLMRTRPGTDVFGFAIRSASSPCAVFALYIPATIMGLDARLTQLAGHGRAHFYLLGSTGVVSASDVPAAVGHELPAPRRTGTTSIGTGANRRVMVAAAPGRFGQQLVSLEPESSFYGSLDSHRQRAVQALVLLVIAGAAGLGLVFWRAHRAAGRSVETLGGLLANVTDAVLVVSDGTIRYASPAVERLLDVAPQDARLRSLPELVGADAAALMDRLVLTCQDRDRPVTVGDVLCEGKDGRQVWVETTVADRRHVQGIRGSVIALHDVTERHEAAADLLHAATHDPLTGLANRARFLEVVDAARRQCERDHKPFAVLFLDLDDFKAVNDGHGHASGDLVLLEIASRLRSCLRTGDTAARLGGDEFAVLLASDCAAADATDVADRIIRAVQVPIALTNATVTVGVSVGAVVAGAGGGGSASLLQDADLAMYAAKERGKNQLHLASQ